MVRGNDSVCPKCGGDLRYYDTIRRVVLGKGRALGRVKIRRFRCSRCRVLHRELTERVFPYKQYEAEIIKGVLEGYITSDTLGFEDYPCEATMARWRARNLQGVL
jgi:hypothetical protein